VYGQGCTEAHQHEADVEEQVEPAEDRQVQGQHRQPGQN
jgi:hypothetical protein